MSRRDTIIVAVLVNTGLLAVLFMLALHTNNSDDSSLIETTPGSVMNGGRSSTVEITNEISFSEAPRDELDQVLKNYPLNSSSPLPIETQNKSENEFNRSDGIVSPVSKASPTVSTNETGLKPASDKDYVEVTVKRGDYLEKIARSNGTTIEAIMKANKLTTERIDIGQVLKIPLSKKKLSETGPIKKNPNKQPEIASGEPVFYTLKSGDNPWKVAKEFHVKFDDLLKLNKLDEEKARGLKPGDSLRVK